MVKYRALIAFVVFAGLLYARPLSGTGAWFFHDFSIAYLPLRQAAAEAIRAGHLPLWESRMGNGFPVFSEGQAGVFYPPHVLGYLGLPQYWVYAVMIAVHGVLAAFFMSALCGVLGLSLWPCILGGIVYGFSGYFVTHAMHLPYVEAPAWTPAVLYAFERWLRTPRRTQWLGWAGLALGVQLLVCSAQFFLYSVVALFLYAAVAMGVRRHERGTPADRPAAGWVLLGAFLVLALAGGVSAIQTLPTSALIAESPRQNPTPAMLRELSMAPHDLAFFLHPYLFGSYREGNYFGGDHHYEVCGYVGTLALLLGVVGAVFARGRGRAFALILIPFALFMALANYNPLYEILPRVPGFRYFRGAGRYTVLSTLGFALLAGYGAHWLSESRRAQRLVAWLGAGGLVVLLLTPPVLLTAAPLLSHKLAARVRTEKGSSPPAVKAAQKVAFMADRLSPADPDGLLILLCLGGASAAAFVALSRGRALQGDASPAPWIGPVLVGLTAGQLYVFGVGYNPCIDPSYYTQKPRLASFLNTARGDCVFVDNQNELQAAVAGNPSWAGGDLSYYFRAKEMLRPNRQVLYDLRSANVFYSLVPQRYWVLTRLLDASLRDRRDADTGLQIAQPREVVDAMGGRVICTARREAFSDLPVAIDFGTWVARLNPDACPVAYFADAVIPCATAEAALAAMCAADYSWRRPPVEAPAAALAAARPGGHSEVLSVDNDHGHVMIHCRAERPAILVLRETYSARFHCRVDGREVPIWRANYLYRAVMVPEGEHEVEFVYVAKGLHLGGMIALLTVVFASMILWGLQRRL